MIADETGQIAVACDKQYPAPRRTLAGGRRARAAHARTVPASVVVCAELDYPDLTRLGWRTARADGLRHRAS